MFEKWQYVNIGLLKFLADWPEFPQQTGSFSFFYTAYSSGGKGLVFGVP